MAKLDEFLLQYYKQLHFNKMPPEVRAQFDAYLKADDFRGDMKKWRDELMHQDPQTGKWINNDLPNPDPNDPTWGLSDDEWDKLFNAFQNAFRAMDANKSKFKDNKKASEFLNEWYGTGKLFSMFQASSITVSYVDDFAHVLNGAQKDNLYSWLSDSFESRADFNDFVKNINDGKYKTDAGVRNKLVKVVSVLNRDIMQGSLDNYPVLKQELSRVNLSGIASGFDDAGNVDPTKRDFLKRNYAILLDALHNDKKIYDEFKQYDNGKISKHLNEAISKTAYDDKESDDFVPAKPDDELTPLQQVSKWWDDTYADTLEKYLKFKGDRLYFSDSAKLIVKAISSAKIKPVDGLDKVLKSAADIKKNLQFKSPRATDHFDWFVKTMKSIQETTPKAFEGALRNGRQMKTLVSKLIINAVESGKMDEAKTALEVLSVIKYGYTTSKIMDTLGKEKLSIFSDGKLSWNKNEGMKFVTTALDKSIKTAFMGIGYGITMVGNAINLSGNKFHGHGGKRIHSAHTAREAQFAQQKQTLEAEKTSAQQQLIAEQTTLTNLATNRGISDATHQDFINVLSLQQKIKTDTQKRDDIVARYPDLDTDITNYQTWLQNNQNNPQARAVREELNQFLQIQIQRDQLNQDITTNEGTLRQMQNNNQYLNVPDLATLATIVSEFDNAKANVQFLTDQINERDAKLNTWDADHKNKFVELMAYWDMLETGRNTHMGKMYNWKPIKAGNAQKKFDGQKQTIISDYLSGYSYAA
jgi:hypothetical protein